MKYINLILFVFLSVLLVACANSHYSTKKNNYLKFSKTLHPIVVPAGANPPAQKPYYVVPKMYVNSDGVKPSMKPPGLG